MGFPTGFTLGRPFVYPIFPIILLSDRSNSAQTGITFLTLLSSLRRREGLSDILISDQSPERCAHPTHTDAPLTSTVSQPRREHGVPGAGEGGKAVTTP